MSSCENICDNSSPSFCGLKRSFNFIYHREGYQQSLQEYNKVGVQPSSNLFRQEIDRYMAKTAVKYDALLLENTQIKTIQIESDGVKIETKNGESFQSQYLVDSSGYKSLLSQQFDLREKPTRLKTQSRSLFAHAIGVKNYDDCFSKSHYDSTSLAWYKEKPMNASIGIRSLSLTFPDTIRTNDYWRENFPHLLPKARKRQRNVATLAEEDTDIWSQAVAPYLGDPFRGARERRILQPEESGLILECRAAKEAIALAGLTTEAIDLALVAALFPDRPGPGHAAYLARAIGLHCPAWQLESTCASALVALETARTFSESGRYEQILIVVSHCGSNATDNTDSLSWSLGDGAGAFVVSPVRGEEGILGIAIAPTTETCDAYRYELADNGKGKIQTLARTGENAIALAETAADAARSCCQKVAEAAGVSLTDIDFFAFNTPTAWYADVCARALGIEGDRALNLYPRYGNIGPVFPLANLERAARTGKLKKGDRVLLYANGAAATAAAAILRWGETVLGVPPAPPLNISPAEERIASVMQGEERRSPTLLSPQQILTAPPSERPALLETYLLGWLAVYLQCSPEELSADLSFGGLLDSLVAIELKRRLEEDFRISVPLQQFLSENNSKCLVLYLCDRLLVKELKDISAIHTDRPREILHF